ncbi:MAG: hypothetical protein ACLQAH_11815 [Limisphaerales bacterium]
MTDNNESSDYTISTLHEKRPDGIRGIAYCPICDKAEESHDYSDDEKQAITISIGKVRLHMRLIHRVKSDSANLHPAEADVH